MRAGRLRGRSGPVLSRSGSIGSFPPPAQGPVVDRTGTIVAKTRQNRDVAVIQVQGGAVSVLLMAEERARMPNCGVARNRIRSHVIAVPPPVKCPSCQPAQTAQFGIQDAHVLALPDDPP